MLDYKIQFACLLTQLKKYGNRSQVYKMLKTRGYLLDTMDIPLPSGASVVKSDQNMPPIFFSLFHLVVRNKTNFPKTPPFCTSDADISLSNRLHI